MQIKSLTYTSFARLDLTDGDLSDIHREATRLNSLDGITGLLIFNGSHFLQVIEGAASAIDDLLARLRRDPRHHQLEVRDERFITDRQFPDWSMKLTRVTSRYFEARDTITSILPPALAADVRERIMRMTEQISGSLKMPD